MQSTHGTLTTHITTQKMSSSNIHITEERKNMQYENDKKKANRHYTQ